MQACFRHPSRRWVELAVALPLVYMFGVGPLPAQEPDTIPRNAALTVEGGGTLGAYEAGLTWGLVETFRQRRILSREASPEQTAGQRMLRTLTPFDFLAAAGASAGSINAFIAASRWCSTDDPGTEKASPFWRAWIPTGIGELLPKGKPSDWQRQKAVFTREGFAPLFAELDDSLEASQYAPDCGLLFGAAITRLAEDSVGVGSNVYARNQRYAAAFTIKGRTPGGTGLTYARLERLDDRIRPGVFAILPDSAGQRVISHGVIHELIQASSGFPLAFAPQPVSYCAPNDNSRDVLPGQVCPPSMIKRRSYFLDGGVFDNGPLTIAYSLALASPKKPSLDSLYMLFVTPSRCRSTGRDCAFIGARRTTAASESKRTQYEEEMEEAQADGLDAVAKMLAVAIPSARQYELQIASRILPGVQDADFRADTAKAARRRMKLAADLQYERFTELWKAARTDVGNLKIANDNLRDALTQCQQHGECLATPRDPFSTAFNPALRTNWLSPVQSLNPADSLARPEAFFREPYGKFLFVTERWHPLAGDWLFGFGGFLGRPLREYDFYVGVYDALALIARRVQGPDTAHFAERFRTLVLDPPIPMSPTARIIVRKLYNVEFPGNQASKLELKLSLPDTARPSLSDSLLIAIVDAIHEMSDSLPPAKKCRGGPIERMECAEGLDVAFAAMRRTPYFRRALRAAREECEALNRDDKRCRDERFEDFVAEPYSALNRLVGSILERLLDATPAQSGLKMPLTIASAAYFSTNERARTGPDQGSVSLPPSVGSVRRKLIWLFPSGIGGYGGLPGYYYEWAARWHLSPEVAIGATTRLVWASGLAGPASPRGRHTVPSIRLERKFGGAAALWVNTFGFDFAYWADWRHGRFRPSSNERKAFSAAATSALFAQKVRVSVGYRPTKYVTRTRSKSRILVSIGAGDVTGTGYWLIRGLAQKFSSR